MKSVGMCGKVVWTLKDFVMDAQLSLEEAMIMQYHPEDGNDMEFEVFLGIFVRIPLEFFQCTLGIF